MKKNLFLMATMLLILALTLAACGGGSQQSSQSSSGSNTQASQPEATQAPAGDPAAGQEKFELTCSACHGKSGEGVPGLGKDMTVSEFIAGKTDTELVEFIKVGRDPSDPLNTTGVAMPPKGGNPSLTDDNLQNIISYIRSLQQ